MRAASGVSGLPMRLPLRFLVFLALSLWAF